ncbi:MAG: glycosyltransferase family 4 protein [Nocardioidaceae bacterium]
MTRRLLWVSLPDQRARRELYWMSRMPDTAVTALAKDRPVGDLTWVPSAYRRPVTRFVEAGALAWVRGLGDQDPGEFDWVASLELCSLVTGQAARWRRRSPRPGHRRPLQAVLTWENLPHQPLYRIPPYRSAVAASRGADLLLCMVDAARDHLLALDFPDELIRVVKPGVDTDLFRPAEQPVADPVVVFCSPLEENKGIDRVLDAMAMVRRVVPEARLVVAGRGRLEGLVRAAAERDPDAVVLSGSLDAAGVAALLRTAAVFVTAPRPTWKWTEQLGLAYLEALACGLPIVTTRCGSNGEAVQPPNERVEDDPEALATALVGWLTDPERRRVVGRHNRLRARTHHDLATQCAAMGAAFGSVEAARR